jgi:hypothetical protein
MSASRSNSAKGNYTASSMSCFRSEYVASPGALVPSTPVLVIG